MNDYTSVTLESIVTENLNVVFSKRIILDLKIEELTIKDTLIKLWDSVHDEEVFLTADRNSI